MPIFIGPPPPPLVPPLVPQAIRTRAPKPLRLTPTMCRFNIGSPSSELGPIAGRVALAQAPSRTGSDVKLTFGGHIRGGDRGRRHCRLHDRARAGPEGGQGEAPGAAVDRRRRLPPAGEGVFLAPAVGMTAPASPTRAFGGGAGGGGAQVSPGEKVGKTARRSGRVEGLLTDRGRVAAAVVIVGPGSRLTDLLP